MSVIVLKRISSPRTDDTGAQGARSLYLFMTTDQRKVALVTGAAKRIGQAVAVALARNGWDIAVHYGRSADEAAGTVAAVQSFGRRCAAIQCDLTDETAVQSLLARAANALGCGQSEFSCVVNNASHFDYDGATDFSFARLDVHMRVNAGAPVLLAQALHDSTPDGGQSVVINLLDQKLYNLNPDFLSYTLSKAALQCATTMLAQALSPKVRVVGVAPGLTMPSYLQSESEFASAHTISPLGESSRPEEVADAVVFAAGNRALTGSTILVDAGQHLMPLSRDFSFVPKT